MSFFHLKLKPQGSFKPVRKRNNLEIAEHLINILNKTHKKKKIKLQLVSNGHGPTLPRPILESKTFQRHSFNN
jgi:hypothetical protein